MKIQSVIRDKLIVWPTDLIVIKAPVASVILSFETDPIIAFIFGLENNPIPNACNIIAIIIICNDVFAFTNDNSINAKMLIVIPINAIFWGWYLSESLPALIAVIDIIIGLIINIKPAVSGSHPLIYWKW